MNQIIAIVGMCGSGKTVAADCLERHGWKRVYFGGVLIDSLKEKGLEITPENENLERERIRKQYGNAGHAIRLTPIIKQYLESSCVVLDGLYSWSEYLYLKSEFDGYLHLLCIASDKEDRYRRLLNRRDRPLSPADAEKRDYLEIETIEKGGPIAIADYYILNDSSIDALEDKVWQLATMIQGITSDKNNQHR